MRALPFGSQARSDTADHTSPSIQQISGRVRAAPPGRGSEGNSRLGELDVSGPLDFLGDQLEAWRKGGSFQHLRELQTECMPVCRFDGREVINLASNNYLGLANHPRLVEAAVKATRQYGVGSGAVRTIT